MTGSLAYRKNEAAILRGDVPKKYLRLLPYIPNGKVLEIGSAEGVLALLLAKRGDDVTALERNPERHEAAQALRDAWGMDRPRFICGDIASHLGLLEDADTLVAVRMIYYLGKDLDRVFAHASRHVRNVVLCGNGNRAYLWREGVEVKSTNADNYYASHEGMTSLLRRHGYSIVSTVIDGDEIVVGRMD